MRYDHGVGEHVGQCRHVYVASVAVVSYDTLYAGRAVDPLADEAGRRDCIDTHTHTQGRADSLTYHAAESWY